MSFEIRPITDDEVEQAEAMVAYAFNNPERRDLAPSVERARRFYSTDWSLASFEDGAMTAFVRTIPFAMRIDGRGLSFGAIGPVVSSPEHRRKGHVGAVLRRSLEVMRERGQVISGLHTPHPTLYQRYGWEIASAQRVYRFAPKDVTLKAQPSERGRFRMLSPDDWSQADRVYRHHSAKRNGPLHRGEVWWREAIYRTTGYVVYHQPTQPDSERGAFWVRELVALTTDAYLNLILYLLRHDLPPEIRWNAPPDDPFYSLVDDASKVRVVSEYDVMLRVNDVERALTSRAFPAHLDASLTLEIADASAPWNEGLWRIEVTGGTARVEGTSGEADLSLSATTLAPVFNGYLSPSAAALAGRARARNEEALARADALFAPLHSPFCSDGF